MRAGKLLVAVAVVLIAFFAVTASAMAGIRLTVTTTDDNITVDGECTLREAIGASNTSTTVGTADCPAGSSSENTVVFAAVLGASPVVNLDIANPNLSVLNNDLTITGPATVNGATNSGFRVITSTGLNLTLNSLTISNGSENVEGRGGGIRQDGGRLFLNDSTVSGNTTTKSSTTTANAEGGGIYASGAPVTLTNSSVANNQAIANCTTCTSGSIALGGGIEVNNDEVTMDNSVVSGNKAIASGDSNGGVEADGGGVRNDGDVLIEHSTISGNLVSATSTGSSAPVVQGGGMLFHGSEAVIDVELSTISNNLMKAPAGTATASQRGGGVENFADSDGIYISDTIVGNGLDPASQTAGVQGLNFQSAGVGIGSRTFDNTIIANPVGSAGSNCFGDTPYSDDTAPNLEFPGSMSDPCFDAAHMNVLHVDPLLGALGNNGGPTPTMLPAATSPVIDQGTASDQNDLSEDQRGLARPVVFSGLTHPFDGADIGAAEVQATCPGQSTPGGSCPSSGGGGGQPTTPPATTAPNTKKKCKKAKKRAASAKNKKCKKKKKKK